MRPELIALLRMLIAIGAGVIISRLLCRGRALFSLAEGALLVLTMGFVFRVTPWLCVVWCAIAVWAGRGAADRERSPQLGWLLAALTLLLFVTRMHEPLLWDEQIWLLKAKLAFTDDLRAAALTNGSDAIPVGYPIAFPLACAWLGGNAVDLGALILRALCMGALAAAIVRERPAALTRVALLLVATPLLLVHARVAYVDLPLGLLSAALYLELTSDRPVALRALVLMTLLAGCKDEGIAHAVVVAIVATLERPRTARTTAGLALLGAGIVFITWRVLLATHAIVATDHTLGAPDWQRLGMILRQLAAHLCDVRSFGLLYAATIAALIASLRVRELRRDGAVVLALLVALLIGVLCGPGRVREFTASGTLLGRLLVQLAPLAALLVARAMRCFSAPTASDALPIPVAAE